MVLVRHDRYQSPNPVNPGTARDTETGDDIPGYDDLFSDEAVQRRFGALIAQAARAAPTAKS